MPSRLTKSDFTSSLAGKKIGLADAASDPTLAGVDLSKADLDHDGVIRGPGELAALFTVVDRYDHNGDAQSIALTGADGTPTQAGSIALALQARAVFDTTEQGPSLHDAALKKTFAAAGALPLSRGASGDRAVAVQYALCRLGFSAGPVDGQFGSGTEQAVRAFQSAQGLTSTGVVDAATLSALDATVSSKDFRTPAEKSGDPLGYLSSQAVNLPKLAPIASRPIDWNNAEVQQAYGAFVGQYWEVCKQNHVESDCKTLALFLMDQFRTKVKADLGVQLPRPGTAAGQIPAQSWDAGTAASPHGYFSRFESLPTIRPGYEQAQAIQRLDPKASLITGVNLRYGGVDANMASKAVKVTVPWSTARDNHGDSSIPEIPVAKLNAGDVIFIDHTGDGKVDHMANVVRVDRDASGTVKRLVLATGSFDDMRDADGATVPNSLGQVNNYTEEVTVDVDAQGRVANSQVTWSSEPGWLTDSRYSARTLLMEMRPGGRISVGRWGQPG